MGMTHFDENGKAIMVDVTEKEDTKREATATGKIIVNQEVYQAIQQGTVRKAMSWVWQQQQGLWQQKEPLN